MHALYILSADDLGAISLDFFVGKVSETLHFGGRRFLRSTLQESYDPPKKLWTSLFLRESL